MLGFLFPIERNSVEFPENVRTKRYTNDDYKIEVEDANDYETKDVETMTSVETSYRHFIQDSRFSKTSKTTVVRIWINSRPQGTL